MTADADKNAATRMPDLYQRLDDLVSSMPSRDSGTSLSSGFTRQSLDEPGMWQPLGEYPPRIIDSAAIGALARCCVFGERVFIGVLGGGGLTPWGRRTFARTEQALTVVFNGQEAVDALYQYDGRSGWTVFPLSLPDSLRADAITAVEIERDGKLLLSQSLTADTAVKNVRPRIRRVNAKGTLLGAVPGVNADVPVEVMVGDRVDWVLTTAPATSDAPRQFEFDFARHCNASAVARILVRNAGSSDEAQGSPICVFGSGRDHFLFANPRRSGDRFAATLLSWKDGKRRPLKLACRKDGQLEIICRADLDDEAGFRYENGRNTFVADMASLQGEVLIVTDENSVLTALPPLQQLLECLPPASFHSDGAATLQRDAANADIIADVKNHLRTGDADAARDRLRAAVEHLHTTDDIETFLRALGAADPHAK
jgi:hypothetical protein